MNEANVQALTEIFLRVHLSRTGMGSEVDTPHAREVCRGIAEGLAAAGVLVPSALTLREIVRVCEDVVYEKERDEFVDQLTRIAAGRPQYDFQESDAKGGEP